MHDPPGSQLSGSPKSHRVRSLVHNDQISKAMQTLMSNACAQGTVKRIMETMHPKRKQDLILHPPIVPQIHISTQTAKAFLYPKATQDKACMDVFGWSAQLLIPIRDRKGICRNIPFLQQLARLIARMTNAEVPDEVAHILTCGGLFALHKLTVEEQATREQKGEDPKLRPVNVGACFLKWAFQLALKEDQPQATMLELGPVQKAIKAPHGVQAVGHLFRALRELGYVICATDFTNGFNALLRQAMLDAINARAPFLNKHFNKFYSLKAWCFLKVLDDYTVILSEEGSRMGCVMGSFGFCPALFFTNQSFDNTNCWRVRPRRSPTIFPWRSNPQNSRATCLTSMA